MLIRYTISAIVIMILLMGTNASAVETIVSMSGTNTHNWGTFNFSGSASIDSPIVVNNEYPVSFQLGLINDRTGSSWVISGYTFAVGIYTSSSSLFSQTPLNQTTLISENGLSLFSGGGGSGSSRLMVSNSTALLSPGQSMLVYLGLTLFVRVCEDSTCSNIQDRFIDTSIQISLTNPIELATITETKTETVTTNHTVTETESETVILTETSVVNNVITQNFTVTETSTIVPPSVLPYGTAWVFAIPVILIIRKKLL